MGHPLFSTSPAAADQSPPVLLAPMAGATDAPFRRQAAKLGCRYTVSEMVASDALAHARPDMVRRTAGAEGLFPLVIQLAGREPEWMARGAALATDAGADVIDINMGCPSKMVTSGASGAALMRDLDHAARLIEAVVSASSAPVTVKMRLGWSRCTPRAADLARRAEDLGAAMVVVHGRAREDFFNGAADWGAIRDVVDAVSIPVIANGDIDGPESAATALAQSGAAGVMVGRAACGRPWLPGQIQAALAGRPAPDLSPSQQLGVLLEMYEDALSLYGERLGVRMARKHFAAAIDACAPWLDPSELRAARRTVCSLETPAAVILALGEVFHERRAPRPQACAA